MQTMTQRTNRSIMWCYFNRISGNPDNKAECKVCRTVLRRPGSNTSSLYQHLRQRHPDIYREAVSDKNPIKKYSRQAEENARKIMRVEQKINTSGGCAKRSVTWNYFEKIELNTVRCNLCGINVKYFGSSTSNLFNHLKLKHPVSYKEAMVIKEKGLEPDHNGYTQKVFRAPSSPLSDITLDASCETELDIRFPESSSTNVTSASTSDNTTSTVSKTQIASTTSRKKTSSDIISKDLVDKYLLKLISINLLPPSIVEIKEFKEMLKALNGRYELPTKSAVMGTLLPEFAFEIKNKLKTDIDSASHFALTVETWKYRHSKRCMTVVAHFITDSWDTSSVVLETVNYPEEKTGSGANLIEELRRITDEWGIGEKVVTLVSDPSEMLSTAAVTMGWEHLFCFGEKLNSVILTALESVPEVTKLLKKVNEVVEYFDLNIKAVETLSTVQGHNKLPGKKLKMQTGNKWMTTYHMMERALEQYEAANTVLCHLGKDDMCLCDEDIEMMQLVVNVLEPFDNAVTELFSSDYDYSSMSKVIPLRNVLQEVLALSADEATDFSSPSMSTFRDFLVQQMEANFGTLERNSTLATCTLLDPRFKHHAFTDSSAVEVAQEQLIEEMTSIAKLSSNPKELSKELDVTQGEISKEKPTKKPLWTLFDKRVSEAGARKSVLSDVENESHRYFKEALIFRDQDPLQWWKLNQVQFPHLQVLAKKYLCIPATSVCSSRLFSKKGEEFNIRRSMIKPNDLDTMLFLSSNVKK